MNKFETYLEFCARAFWGQWNKALLKIVMLFVVALLLTFIAKTNGLLLGDNDNASVVGIALLATAATVSIGFVRKKKII